MGVFADVGGTNCERRLCHAPVTDAGSRRLGWVLKPMTKADVVFYTQILLEHI